MKYSLIFVLAMTALLSGCGSAEKQEPGAVVADAAAPVAMEPPSPSAAADKEQPDDAPSQNQVPGRPAAPRLLVYHADLRLKVASLPKASAKLDSLVRRSGGYTSASSETREDGEWRQETTIRVQPGRFGALLTALTGLGTVEQKKLTTDDVTAEHADVAARLRAKRAVEQRYLALLNQAKKVSDILEIEAKVGEVREEIESTESRLKTLNDEVAYSTVTLTCYQLLAQSVPEAPVVSFASRVVESFYTGWTLITGLFIGLVALWPFLLLTPAVWWAVRRWRQRRGPRTT